MYNMMKMSAGKYWIGDPCYIFPHTGPMKDKWDEILQKSDYFSKYYGELDNGKIKVWAAPTAFGDGSYFSNTGKEFPVDAGMIGIVPYETVEYFNRNDNDLSLLGLFIEFEEPFIVGLRGGCFTFGNIEIDTAEDDEGNDDDEFEWLYDYDGQ